jgi:hypothetical protein
MKPAGASVCHGMVRPYLMKGRYCNTTFIKGSANFIFHHIEAASYMVTFVYDVFYAVRIYIRIGY